MERDGHPKRKNPEDYKEDVDFNKWRWNIPSLCSIP